MSLETTFNDDFNAIWRADNFNRNILLRQRVAWFEDKWNKKPMRCPFKATMLR